MKLNESLLDIVEEIKSKNAHYIVIDGTDGSGKSSLANKIANKMGFIHINLDNYLDENHGYFVEHIKYDLLNKKIEDANSPIIIEGVCALAVIKKLKIKCDLHIYIKRMADFGYWKDNYLYDANEDMDTHIDKQNVEYRKFCAAMAHIEGEQFDSKDTSIPKLTEELIRYHYEFKPQEVANIIYERKN